MDLLKLKIAQNKQRSENKKELIYIILGLPIAFIGIMSVVIIMYVFQ